MLWFRKKKDTINEENPIKGFKSNRFAVKILDIPEWAITRFEEKDNNIIEIGFRGYKSKKYGSFFAPMYFFEDEYAPFNVVLNFLDENGNGICGVVYKDCEYECCSPLKLNYEDDSFLESKVTFTYKERVF